MVKILYKSNVQQHILEICSFYFIINNGTVACNDIVVHLFAYITFMMIFRRTRYFLCLWPFRFWQETLGYIIIVKLFDVCNNCYSSFRIQLDTNSCADYNTPNVFDLSFYILRKNKNNSLALVLSTHCISW